MRRLNPRAAIIFSMISAKHAQYPTANMQHNYQLSRLRLEDQATFAALIAYLQRCRRQMFAALATNTLAEDLCNFQQVYIDDPLGGFFILKDQQQIIASIGFRAYDRRFSHFHLSGQRVVELLRLYVEPNYRRQGLASYLLQQLKAETQARGIDCLYLHTHPFLPGALEFWQQHGFSLICQDHDDAVWQTIHMQHQCPVSAEQED